MDILCNRSDHLLDDTFKGSWDAILIARQSDRHILAANGAATRAYGLSEPELLGLTVGGLEAEGQTSQVLHYDQAGTLLKSIHRRRDGRLFPVEISERVATVNGCRVVISTVRDTSARIKVEAGIKTLAQFPAENPNPVLRVDLTGKISYLNPPARKFLSDMGWQLKDTLPSQLADAVRSAIDVRSVRGLEVSTPGEHVFWFVIAPNQREGYVNLYASDITERKIAERKLRQSEERLRALIQAVPALTFEGDAEGNNTFSSNGWFEFTGLTAEETAGHGWARALHPEDAEAVKSRWFESLKTGTVFESRHRFCRKDGSSKWFIAKVLPTRDESGKIIRWTGSLTDVDDLCRAELSVRQSMEDARQRAEELQKVMELVPVGVWVAHDSLCRVITGNPAANEMLEAGSGENVSITIDLARRTYFKDGVQIPSREMPMQQAAAKGVDIRDVEIDVVLPSGNSITILGGASPLTDHRGKVRGSVAAFMDITERKRTEIELNDYRSSLEEKVRKRTSQLAKAVAALERSQEDLRELSRKSIEAIEADRRSSSRDLHDSIGGSLSALSFLLEEAADRVDDPALTADRLKKALSFVKITIKEARRISANLRPLSLDDLGLLATIRGYVHQFQFQYGIKGTCKIALSEKDVPETLKIVIFRLVQEALSNAGKHSHASNVSVKIVNKDKAITLKVQDDGLGFAPQKLESKDPLSGYGLKSMRERTEICKGRFTIRSKPGGGTLIKAIFPLNSGEPCG